MDPWRRCIDCSHGNSDPYGMKAGGVMRDTHRSTEKRMEQSSTGKGEDTDLNAQEGREDNETQVA